MSLPPMPVSPVPVQALPYTRPFHGARPGIITAIGVISIVVASLSLIGNLINGLYGFGLLMASQMMNSMAQGSVYATSGSVTIGPGGATVNTPPQGFSGLTQQQRQGVLRSINAVHRLRTTREPHFDQLLAEVGQHIGLTVTADGQTPNLRTELIDDGKFPVSEGGEDADFFMTPAGRIELFDDRATFVSTDNSISVSVVAGTPGTTPAGGNPALTAAEARNVVATVQNMSANLLNAAQVQALTQALQSPNQILVPAGTASFTTGWAQQNADGTVTVNFDSATITLDSHGAILAQTNAPGPIFGGAPWASSLDARAAMLVILESVLSLALAVYLLVIGILVLRQSPRGAALHAVYAWIKIPLAILGGVAIAMLWGSFIGGMMQGAVGASDVTAVYVIAAMIALAGCIYPIALLIVLRTRGVRDYYNSVAGAG